MSWWFAGGGKKDFEKKSHAAQAVCALVGGFYSIKDPNRFAE